jgi:hypothetical protein
MLIDVIAIVLGIWLGVRRMDVRVRQAVQYPDVDPKAFAAWQARASFVYHVGTLGCFAEIALDHGFELVGRKLGLGFRPLQAGHALIFLGWLASLGWVWVQARRARKIQQDLGVSGPPRPAPGELPR